MKGIRIAVLFAVSAVLMLGVASSAALAHHDGSSESGVVFEGAGGK